MTSNQYRLVCIKRSKCIVLFSEIKVTPVLLLFMFKISLSSRNNKHREGHRIHVKFVTA